MAFVDRDTEAYRIASANLCNKCLDTSEPPTLVTAGQLYGAGKTQMGMHAVARVHESQAIRNRLMSDGEEAAAVEDYVNAVTVLVDISTCASSELSDFDVYLGYALFQSIRGGRKSHSLVAWPDIFPKDFTYGVHTVCKMFIAEAKRSIFIHWDEVGLEKALSYMQHTHAHLRSVP